MNVRRGLVTQFLGGLGAGFLLPHLGHAWYLDPSYQPPPRGHVEAGPAADRGVGELCIQKLINLYPTPSRRKGDREKVLRVRKRGPTPGLMVSVYSSSHWARWLMIRESGRQTFVALLIVRWGSRTGPSRLPVRWALSPRLAVWGTERLICPRSWGLMNFRANI